MKLNLLLVSAVTFATLSLTAKAQVITELNNETLFNTAVTGQTVDDFGTNADPYAQAYVDYTDTAGSFYDNFGDSGGDVYIVNSSAMTQVVGSGDGSDFLVANSNGAVTFTANAGYSAVGANFFAVASFTNDIPFTVTATSTTDPSDIISHTFTLDLPAATGSPSDYFAGFLAPVGFDITSISYPVEDSGPENGNGPGIDNFRAGVVNYSVAIPEPSSLGLIMIGSLSLWGLMRLRARSSKA